jgi:hypothetical protein
LRFSTALRLLQVIEKVLGSVWVPIETAGIVLVVLIFVLLEHERCATASFASPAAPTSA